MTGAVTDPTRPDHATSYPPVAEFAARANADATLAERALTDRDGFWAEQANRLHWHKPFT
ncbi:acetyl-coenzyme A synthetase N-terminal domain-containing protein, partial [Nocardia sp. NPDC058497]|uniref:acetyl-coenzyme A synthetase N-terminal domain-containing protein n=1 Tax=Nocardia sp. NPDC058497 TaxID=3346529 RepID=UPI003666B0D9